jgi:cytoskeleton protein RodZ
MKETSKDEIEIAPEVVIGPGVQLRKARERQGLDRLKLAAQLHLSQAMISALESDDFDKLPGPVFVQGYLRKYARLLGVNEDAIIASYQHLFPVQDKQLHETQKREVSRELHSSYRGTRYVTWGVLLILVTMLFFWWKNRVVLEEPVSLPEEAQMEIDLEESSLEQVVTQPELMQAVVSEPESATQRVVEESEQVLSEVDKLVTNSDPILPVEADTSELPIETVKSEQELLPAPVVESAEADPAPAVTSKRVVFTFNAPCWTEVRDREGKLRIFGELDVGRQRVLDSQFGPFTVLLGNAPEVELTIDGEDFDLKPYTRGKVARFTLDPNRL